MAITRTRKPQRSATLRTDQSHQWLSPGVMLNVTYVCVGLAIVLVASQFALYGIRYKRLFDNSTYQAVTLTNGQTFIGVLKRYSMDAYVLQDVYYLQPSLSEELATEEAVDSLTADASDQLELVKLENDFHQPQNFMVINGDQLLYWQNLQADSEIVSGIQKTATE